MLYKSNPTCLQIFTFQILKERDLNINKANKLTISVQISSSVSVPHCKLRTIWGQELT